MTSVTTCLFDLDGTLIDSIDLILECYAETCRELLPATPDRDHFRRRLGIPLRAVFAEIAPATQIEQLVARYREHNQRLHDSMVTAYRGVPELVSGLQERGLRLGVVTSKLREVAERGLSVCGIGAAFEIVVGANCVVRHKPDPAPILHALDRMGLTPERAIYIGDSPFDMEAGRRAGCQTAAVLWGPFTHDELAPTEPTYVLREPAELAERLAAVPTRW